MFTKVVPDENTVTFRAEDGGITLAKSVAIYLHVHTTLVTRRPTSTRLFMVFFSPSSQSVWIVDPR